MPEFEWEKQKQKQKTVKWKLEDNKINGRDDIRYTETRISRGYESQRIEDFHRILKMVPSSEGWVIWDIIVTGPRIPGSLLWDCISHTRGSVCKSSPTWLRQHERNKNNKTDMPNCLFGEILGGLNHTQKTTVNKGRLGEKK